MEMVLGNNDFFSNLDREREIELAGHRIFITHGHYYGVSIDQRRKFIRLMEYAVQLFFAEQ